jgi:DNA-binding LytR/AlgR family response regulator
MTTTVFAVDDEPVALRRLELLIQRMPNFSLIGTAGSGAAALDRIPELRPEILLLDIRMAGMDGFGLLDALAPLYRTSTVFVTAFDSFAARAFDASAIDYVLKPVHFERLQAALEKAQRQLGAGDVEVELAELRAVVAALRTSQGSAGSAAASRELWAERNGRFVRVPVEEIVWVEAEGDYILLHTGADSAILRESLTRMHERLGNDFLRVRRSALVRKAAVKSFRRLGYGHFVVDLDSGPTLRVGATYVPSLKPMLRNG